MRYQSTRNNVKGKSFQDVLMAGYANDGGFFMPEVIPVLTTDELKQFSSFNYAELCREIVKKFVASEEYQKLGLHELIGQAFTKFACEEVVPVKKVGNVYISELWHGRTMAFKDLGTSCLGLFAESHLKQQNLHANVICATSGDTGSAVMESVKGSRFIDVFTLFPEGRCSEIQERQMVCLENENVNAYSTQGTSDDFDIVMAEIFNDREFSSQNTVMSFNSLNWVRILIQIVHFFFSYFRAVESIGDLATIVVPSGGLGNLTAGYISTAMGLPIKLVAAVNQNGATHKILSTGIFEEPREVLRSSSCSMDIAVPYNIERLIYLGSNRDDTTARIMNSFKKSKSVVIPEVVLSKLRQTIQSASVSEEDVTEAVKSTWDVNHYHIDPHTAVAVAIALNPEKYGIALHGKTTICLSCASPQKFPEIFKELDIPLEPTDEIVALLAKPKRFVPLRKGDNWTRVLKDDIMRATKKFTQAGA